MDRTLWPVECLAMIVKRGTALIIILISGQIWSSMSCFRKMSLRNDVKGLSKKARSIVQRSHAPKFSWLQVPPSAHVAQYAASASRIFIFWCEYSHIKNCCKSSQLLFNFWCQLQLNACCQSILIISVVLTYFKISVMYSTYGCSRYIYQIYHSLFFRSSAMPLNAGSPICRTELGCAPL